MLIKSHPVDISFIPELETSDDLIDYIKPLVEGDLSASIAITEQFPVVFRSGSGRYILFKPTKNERSLVLSGRMEVDTSASAYMLAGAVSRTLAAAGRLDDVERILREYSSFCGVAAGVFAGLTGCGVAEKYYCRSRFYASCGDKLVAVEYVGDGEYMVGGVRCSVRDLAERREDCLAGAVQVSRARLPSPLVQAENPEYMVAALARAAARRAATGSPDAARVVEELRAARSRARELTPLQRAALALAAPAVAEALGITCTPSLLELVEAVKNGGADELASIPKRLFSEPALQRLLEELLEELLGHLNSVVELSQSLPRQVRVAEQ